MSPGPRVHRCPPGPAVPGRHKVSPQEVAAILAAVQDLLEAETASDDPAVTILDAWEAAGRQSRQSRGGTRLPRPPADPSGL